MAAAELHTSWRTRTRAASRAEMEEAEEAARVQAEAALALGSALASAGGGHDVVCWRRPPLPSTTFPKHSSCDEIWRGLGERGSHDVKVYARWPGPAADRVRLL